ncbi:ferredoxin [Candidatus Peregrinibacteria bacterium]|nr:ferredoxin [Candidatus Peregrinibacteria bacterium]
MSSSTGTQFQHTIAVDQDTCIGCGVCAALCPQAYEMSTDDGKSYVTESANHDDPAAKEAEVACPVNAIAIT